MNTPSANHSTTPVIENALRAVPGDERRALRAVWHHVRDLDLAAYEQQPARLHQIRIALVDHIASDRHTSRRRYAAWAVAATFLLALVAGGYLWLKPVTIVTDAGSTQTTTLPDGSLAELNENTSLTYRRWPSQRARRVTLDGEAYFDVVTRTPPFVVETVNATVTVKGTRFSVRAVRQGSAPVTEVFLVEGRVQVSSGGANMVLQPGQRSRVVHHTAPSAPETGQRTDALGWRQRRLSFRNETVQRIFAEIARQFDITVSMNAWTDAGLRTQHLTYIAHREMTAEALISDICRIAGLRYRATAQGYEIIGQSASTSP